MVTGGREWLGGVVVGARTVRHCRYLHAGAGHAPGPVAAGGSGAGVVRSWRFIQPLDRREREPRRERCHPESLENLE
jgi:hypothetical protein